MDFKGHFTGTFGKTKGQGQAVDFIATDLLKVTNGRKSSRSGHGMEIDVRS
jgi:hypothetical protein